MELRPTPGEARRILGLLCGFWSVLGVVALALPSRGGLVPVAFACGVGTFWNVYRVAERESGRPARLIARWDVPSAITPEDRAVRRAVDRRIKRLAWLGLVARQTGWPYAVAVGALAASLALALAGVGTALATALAAVLRDTGGAP